MSSDPRPQPVAAATAGSPIVIDGGLSNVLQDRGHDLSDRLWTARLLRDAPHEIAEVHRAYYAAGARVATTASYQASVPGWTAAGVAEADGAALVGSSVTIARDVRDSMAGDGVQRWVAASIGPYGAVLADGSEYRGRYGLSAAALRDFHLPRMELLAAAGPDLLAVETIPDVDEAEVLVTILDELALPAWFSYTIDGDRTRAGQPLADAFAVAGSAANVIAVGVNCCRPSDVLPAVRQAAKITGKPAVGYPNSGRGWDATARRWIGPSGFDPALAPLWRDAGARWIGGCCRVGPGEIGALARTVADHVPS
ncbi:homocysteine S-methyltransferase [Microlunatus soli]|uniref:Homocysteine S-methyltransferase n=1 Tax=Microlunatus soli TaxID=630515 RepID=A0A1H1TFS4_9ACTN|nr:homocysteine S-methyltransferase [Microlunatus soli]SDS58911.1 homocysteine S-methyltransferase [Microlunatus soli]